MTSVNHLMQMKESGIWAILKQLKAWEGTSKLLLLLHMNHKEHIGCV